MRTQFKVLLMVAVAAAAVGWPFVAVVANEDQELIADVDEVWDIGSVRPSVGVAWTGEVRTRRSAALSILSKSCSCVDVGVTAGPEAGAYTVTAGAIAPPYGPIRGWVVLEARSAGRVAHVRIDLKAEVVFDIGIVVAPKRVHIREGVSRAIEVDVVVVMDGGATHTDLRRRAAPNLTAEPSSLVSMIGLCDLGWSDANRWSARVRLALAETVGVRQEQPLVVRIGVEGAAGMSDSVEVWSRE